MDFARSTHPASRPARPAELSRRRPPRARAHQRPARPPRPAPGRASARLPRRRDQRQGLDLRLPPRRARSRRARTVHVFTSPHLVRFNERIRVAGRLIDDEPLAALLDRSARRQRRHRAELLRGRDRRRPARLRAHPADACILEVGLGGRLDATNVVDRPAVCGIASLALDHQQFLGTRSADIAAEKAGIAKPGVPLVALRPARRSRGRHRGAAPRGAARRCCSKAATGCSTRRSSPRCRVPTRFAMPTSLGRCSASGCADRLAGRVPGRARRSADGRRASSGSAHGPLAGGPRTWVDGAHNPAAAAALAELLAERGPMHLVLGILANKDADAIVAAFAPHALSLTFVPVADHAHHDPQGSRAKLRRPGRSRARGRAGGLARAAADRRLALSRGRSARRER